ncbi:NAD(P)H-binding protein [Mycolicibacterium flavescens]|uniref:Epimerase n=1 Tax=Mycolicibacterium flavescens TaxID=1776 RepID=A0A1E3RE77_MYCFV|nr:NAD(P)H-binding protein [Mycolicibacterium flavescens]MCV7282721.1 NAD(P)H-binding protein [Mycolicibacterium flavescens]ODQ88170.1 epimerase [Mycolicibacterium flavescens]
MPHSILVTGATGTLGHRVVPEAVGAGHRVRALSRRSHVGYTGVHWAQGDLLDGTGLDAALDGIDVVVNCATQPTGGKDVNGMRNLVAAAARAGVAHIVHVSIVGIDRIPLPYYRAKLGAERVLTGSGVRHTVLRATQFHELLRTMFAVQRYSPVLWALRGVRFQPIDTAAVAARLVELADAPPVGRAPDIGGPTVHTHAELAQMYLDARRSRRRVVALPVPGRTAAALRAGANLVPDNPVGTVGFADYLGGAPGSPA